MTEASGFELLPAIDLRGGRVVRLHQGDFALETAYSDDPVEVARGFATTGAHWLHVVDLDAARSGVQTHGSTIAAIEAAVGDRIQVEVAGGLRDEAAVGAALASGAARVVVGTAALRDPAFAGRLVATHGTDRIAAAIDVRDGLAVGHGWSREADGAARGNAEAHAAIERLADVGVTTFEVTAIDRDGSLEGPDLRLYERLIGLGAGAIVASGGVATLEDLRRLRIVGCAGAILGRALYEGKIDLADALALAASP